MLAQIIIPCIILNMEATLQPSDNPPNWDKDIKMNTNELYYCIVSASSRNGTGLRPVAVIHWGTDIINLANEELMRQGESTIETVEEAIDQHNSDARLFKAFTESEKEEFLQCAEQYGVFEKAQSLID